MEINQKMLMSSMDLAKENQLFDQLNILYNSIPKGQCNGCASCCMESVNAFYIEFLNIYNYVKHHQMYDKIMARIEAHYFNELIRVDHCPFLENNQCLIYDVRPHVCRLFGHSTQEDHEENYLQVLELNQAADDYFFDEFGIHLRDEVVMHKIEYCQAFKIDQKMSKGEKMHLIDQLFMIDTQFLIKDILNEDMLNMSITNWFIYLKYTEDQASDVRIDRLLNASPNHD